MFFRLSAFVSVVAAVSIRHVVLQISDESLEVVHNQRKQRDVDFNTLHSSSRAVSESEYSVYYHADGKEQHAHSFMDKQRLFGDTWDESTQNIAGGQHRKKYGYVALTIPDDATHIILRHNKGKKPARQVHLPKHEFLHAKFSQMALADNVELLTSPLVTAPVGPPDKHKNVVFMPCGYQESEKHKFIAAVIRAQKALSGELRASKGFLQSAPWDRYWSLINVYTVWQPSVDSGASFPVSKDGKSGGNPVGNEIIKNTNLQCQYGVPEVRWLKSDEPQALSLASFTPSVPERQLVVVIVNDVVYGGSGLPGMLTVFAGEWTECTSGDECTKACTTDSSGTETCKSYQMTETNKFLRVLVHELGHGDSGLLDEYEYPTDNSEQEAFPNCHWTSSESEVPWSHWLVPSYDSFGPWSSPVKVCGYRNYYKAMDHRCLMESEAVNEMGPECAEAAAEAILKHTDNFVANPCPKEAETMIIFKNDDRHWIAVQRNFLAGAVGQTDLLLEPGAHKVYPAGHPRALVDQGILPLRVDRGLIRITWFVNGKQRGSPSTSENPQAYIVVTGNDPEFGGVAQSESDAPFEIIARIEDDSAFIKKSSLRDKRTKDFIFRVKVVDPNSPDATSGRYSHCGRADLSQRTAKDLSAPTPVNECTQYYEGDRFYCAVCDAGKICNDSYAIRPLEAQANVEGVVASAEEWVFGIGGAVLVGGFIIFLAAWLLLAKCLSNDARDIADYPKPVEVMRWLMLITASLTMLFSMVVACVAVYKYTDFSAFFKVLLLLAIVAAAILFAVSFIGFTAAFYRSRILLIINGIVLTIVVTFLLGVGAVILYVGANVDSQEYTERMQETWIEQVQKNPKSMCTFQSTFECSGFSVACHNKRGSQCPGNCDVTNRANPSPCYNVAKTQVKDNFLPVGVVTLVFGFAMLCGWINNWVLCCCIRERKKQLKSRFTGGKGGKGPNPNSADYGITVMKNVTDKERRRLKKEFEKFDKSETGTMNAVELQKFLKKTLGVKITDKQAESAVRKLAPEGKKRINGKQYIDTFKKREAAAAEGSESTLTQHPNLQHLPPKDVQAMLGDFKRLDTAGEGHITTQQLCSFYKEIHGNVPSDSQLQKALQVVGNDGSGKVQFHEFCLLFCG